MASYQILYWRHIPLGVKAIDVNGMVRVNLPDRFQQMFQQAAAQRTKTTQAGPFTTSGFYWGDRQEREGSAAEVADRIVQELSASWDSKQALAQFEQGRDQTDPEFLDLEGL